MAKKVEEVEEKNSKQKQLPEMEDPALQDVEDAAIEYAQIRDRRMAFTDKEVNAKELLLAAMKRHDKTKYYRHTKKGAIRVERLPEGEKLRVRIEDED